MLHFIVNKEQNIRESDITSTNTAKIIAPTAGELHVGTRTWRLKNTPQHARQLPLARDLVGRETEV